MHSGRFFIFANENAQFDPFLAFVSRLFSYAQKMCAGVPLPHFWKSGSVAATWRRYQSMNLAAVNIRCSAFDVRCSMFAWFSS